MMALFSILFLCLLFSRSECHHNWSMRMDGITAHKYANTAGVIVNFEHPVYSNGYFLGFEGWNQLNKKYGASNITYLIRIEFDRVGLRENRIKRHFKRYWLPGSIWVERNVIQQSIYSTNLTNIKTREVSQVDVWVYPKCFLRHHGISRLHRVAKSMKTNIKSMNWLAKIYFAHEEKYGPRELMEIGKALTRVAGIQCSWIHPPMGTSFEMMLRFFPGDVPSKNFFSPTIGYNHWNYLNDKYQVTTIRFIRSWNRALIDFSGGLNCRETRTQIAKRYQSLPGVRLVYLDTLNDCHFTYQIVIAFDRKIMNPRKVRAYQHWKSLNHIYGVVNIVQKYAHQLKTILEFEPGLFSHQQMKAIRDEYLKLPGIRFGWVTGKRALEVSTIILNFSPQYLKRVPLRLYQFWDGLNKRYLTNVTILQESRHRAYIRFPERRYSHEELKVILRRYRQLPGIVGVRMDKEQSPIVHSREEEEEEEESNSTLLMMPPKRSLQSWMRLSNADTSQLRLEDEYEMDNRIIRPAEKDWATTCVNDT